HGLPSSQEGPSSTSCTQPLPASHLPGVQGPPAHDRGVPPTHAPATQSAPSWQGSLHSGLLTSSAMRHFCLSSPCRPPSPPSSPCSSAWPFLTTHTSVPLIVPASAGTAL